MTSPNQLPRRLPSEPMADRRPLPLEAALDRVGDRWSLLVVEAMLDGPRRFGELPTPCPASPRTS